MTKIRQLSNNCLYEWFDWLINDFDESFIDSTVIEDETVGSTINESVYEFVYESNKSAYESINEFVYKYPYESNDELTEEFGHESTDESGYESSDEWKKWIRNKENFKKYTWN